MLSVRRRSQSVASDDTLELPWGLPPRVAPSATKPGLVHALTSFAEFGTTTRLLKTAATTPLGKAVAVPTFVNEFWTARQRQADNLHEVSYRACFKPQLPRFFIERLTEPGDLVYDPFMGRGTTLVEAALLGRVPCGCDANPLSLTFVRPRLSPPLLTEVKARLDRIAFSEHDETPADLLAFYHPDTLKQICSLKKYLLDRRATGQFDRVDDWIALVALNRLTGHSNGFFSVYTLPPNQATSVKAQQRINERRKQVPSLRQVPAIILKKSRQLLANHSSPEHRTLAAVGQRAVLLTAPADQTPAIAANSISLVVTSPPFLDIVQYATDNWLRCWFLGIDAKAVKLTVPGRLDEWVKIMTEVLRELHRILKPGGHIAFEVGEIRGGKIKLEQSVLSCGLAAGLQPVLVLINDQKFTKTANCWGVDNMEKGTNTNRIVLFTKDKQTV